VPPSYLPWSPWVVRHKIEMILSLSHCPRWPRQVRQWHKIADGGMMLPMVWLTNFTNVNDPKASFEHYRDIDVLFIFPWSRMSLSPWAIMCAGIPNDWLKEDAKDTQNYEKCSVHTGISRTTSVKLSNDFSIWNLDMLHSTVYKTTGWQNAVWLNDILTKWPRTDFNSDPNIT